MGAWVCPARSSSPSRRSTARFRTTLSGLAPGSTFPEFGAGYHFADKDVLVNFSFRRMTQSVSGWGDDRRSSGDPSSSRRQSSSRISMGSHPSWAWVSDRNASRSRTRPLQAPRPGWRNRGFARPLSLAGIFGRRTARSGISGPACATRRASIDRGRPGCLDAGVRVQLLSVRLLPGALAPVGSFHVTRLPSAALAPGTGSPTPPSRREPSRRKHRRRNGTFRKRWPRPALDKSGEARGRVSARIEGPSAE